MFNSTPVHLIYAVSDIASKAFKTDITSFDFTVPISVSKTRSSAIT